LRVRIDDLLGDFGLAADTDGLVVWQLLQQLLLAIRLGDVVDLNSVSAEFYSESLILGVVTSRPTS
jgi:hypothetical protein